MGAERRSQRKQKFHLFCKTSTAEQAFCDTYPESPSAERGLRRHYMECSGTERGRRHCWARDRAGDNCRGHVPAAAAAVRGDGPGGLMCRAGTAGRCGCWGRIRLGSWKRSDADREADRGLWVHTVREVRTKAEEGKIRQILFK